MPLVVEDGSGRNDADSYVSVEGCGAYHDAMGNTGWVVLETGEEADIAANLKAREIAIRKATAFIERSYGYRFRGRKATAAQALSWPRENAVDDDDFVLSGIPMAVKKATCEAAIKAFVGVDLMPDQERGGKVLSESVGSISVTYASGAPAGTVFDVIDFTIRPVLGANAVSMVRA